MYMFLDKVKLSTIYLVLSENKCPQVTFIRRNDKRKWENMPSRNHTDPELCKNIQSPWIVPDLVIFQAHISEYFRLILYDLCLNIFL